MGLTFTKELRFYCQHVCCCSVFWSCQFYKGFGSFENASKYPASSEKLLNLFKKTPPPSHQKPQTLTVCIAGITSLVSPNMNWGKTSELYLPSTSAASYRMYFYEVGVSTPHKEDWWTEVSQSKCAYGNSALCGCKCSLCYISMILEWCQPCKWADPNSGKNTRDLKSKSGLDCAYSQGKHCTCTRHLFPCNERVFQMHFIKMCQALYKWKSFWHNLSFLYFMYEPLTTLHWIAK